MTTGLMSPWSKEAVCWLRHIQFVTCVLTNDRRTSLARVGHLRSAVALFSTSGLRQVSGLVAKECDESGPASVLSMWHKVVEALVSLSCAPSAFGTYLQSTKSCYVPFFSCVTCNDLLLTASTRFRLICQVWLNILLAALYSAKGLNSSVFY